jgi:hypothetical protein
MDGLPFQVRSTKGLKKIGVTISMNIGGLYNLAYSLIENT